jgi:hypothetical protein
MRLFVSITCTNYGNKPNTGQGILTLSNTGFCRVKKYNNTPTDMAAVSKKAAVLPNEYLIMQVSKLTGNAQMRFAAFGLFDQRRRSFNLSKLYSFFKLVAK